MNEATDVSDECHHGQSLMFVLSPWSGLRLRASVMDEDIAKRNDPPRPRAQSFADGLRETKLAES